MAAYSGWEIIYKFFYGSIVEKYNFVFISAVQQSDSVTHIYTF